MQTQTQTQLIMKTRLLAFVSILVLNLGYAQTNPWTQGSTKNQKLTTTASKVSTQDQIIYKLDIATLKNALTKSPHRAKSSSNEGVLLTFPNRKGELEKFRVSETSVLHPALAKKYPSIKSYIGVNIINSSSVIRFSLSNTNGFHGMIMRANGPSEFIDPYTENRVNYVVYTKGDMTQDEEFTCELRKMGVEKKPENRNFQQRNANDGMLRTYRLAFACTGEYAQFHINDQGVSSSATDAVKKAAVLAAMNTTMTRVNGIYETDLGVTMQIVANNDKVIYLNGNTDPYGSQPIDQNQATCDQQIGNGNYDIGHVVGTGDGGVAGLGVVCGSRKAEGFTGRNTPKGDPFDVDYVAHEIGHQFGANHTQNNSCQRNSSTAMEPGSASTIMGYAGICSPNVQNNSDDHFHAISIQEMWAHVTGSGSCAQNTTTGNTAPTANAGSNFTIPKSTPFVLKGAGTDVDTADQLTYNWEQMDAEVATMPPVATSTSGPAFRSIPSKTSPDRYMPDLATVIAGNTASEWEVVPSVARTMDFRLTVRDNHAGGGNTASDDTKITVSGNAGPFVVNAPNTNVNWTAGSTQTVTWSVAGTTGNGVNAANVDILLSTDGGNTYAVTIASAVTNDGSHSITVPNNAGTQNRIMVRGTNHIFYDISNANFTITGGTVDNQAPTTPTGLTTSNVTQTTIDLSWTASTDNVGVTGYDVYQGNTVVATVTGTTRQITGLTANTAYSFRVKAKDAAGNESGFSNTATATTLQDSGDTQAPSTPANLASSNITQTTVDLSWTASTDNVGVTGYDVYQGNTVVATVTGTTRQVPGLTANTAYSFRVKAKDAAGNESGFSNTVSVTTLTDTTDPTYCASNGRSVTDEYISNVSLGTINNTTTGSSGGYGDYTSISTSLSKGVSNTITITPTWTGSAFNEAYSVWIDYNRDGDFEDSGEQVWSKAASQDTPVSGSFTVPNTATNGNTRMRVSMKYNGIPTSCESFSYGEVEDYAVAITGGGTTPTCTDGIQNGDETGIDCGGSSCAPCQVTVTYCTATGNEGPEGVSNVTFAGINNTSTRSANGYEDHTSSTANVSTGTSHNLKVTIIGYQGGSADEIYAWIDWNQDGDFADANENYTVTKTSNLVGELSITVPQTATVGSTRMRVLVSYYNNENNPCDTGTNDVRYGEYEDYTVAVAAGKSKNLNQKGLFSIGTNPVQHNGRLNVNFSTSETGLAKYEIYTSTGRRVAQYNEKKDIERAAFLGLDGKLKTGLYVLKVSLNGNSEAKTFIVE